MAKERTKAVDLGLLQDQAEQAAKNYKSAQSRYKNAYDAFQRAEEECRSTQKALADATGGVLVKVKVQ